MNAFCLLAYLPRQLADGIDPSAAKKAAKKPAPVSIDNSFEIIAREWLDRQTDKAEVTRAKSEWLLSFAIAEFGKLPINEITPPQVLAACRKLESEGKLETARRIRSKCSQVFRYAVAIGKAERDPTSDLRGALKPPVVKHRAAITEPKDVGPLLRDMDAYAGTLEVRCALQLSPLVFLRPGELRSARWSDIDIDSRLWKFTPPKTRNQTGLELIIPLSSQAIAILETLKEVNGHKEFVFASWGKSGHLSEGAVLQALKRLGYDTGNEMSGHGFRAMARTILEEVLKFKVEVIEQRKRPVASSVTSLSDPGNC